MECGLSLLPWGEPAPLGPGGRGFLSWESCLLPNLHLSSQVPATVPLYWDTFSDAPRQKPQLPQSSHLVVLLDDTLGGQRVGLKAPGQA